MEEYLHNATPRQPTPTESEGVHQLERRWLNEPTQKPTQFAQSKGITTTIAPEGAHTSKASTEQVDTPFKT